jgi:hypothetical protein
LELLGEFGTEQKNIVCDATRILGAHWLPMSMSNSMPAAAQYFVNEVLPLSGFVGAMRHDLDIGWRWQAEAAMLSPFGILWVGDNVIGPARGVGRSCGTTVCSGWRK